MRVPVYLQSFQPQASSSSVTKRWSFQLEAQRNFWNQNYEKIEEKNMIEFLEVGGWKLDLGGWGGCPGAPGGVGAARRIPTNNRRTQRIRGGRP